MRSSAPSLCQSCRTSRPCSAEQFLCICHSCYTCSTQSLLRRARYALGLPVPLPPALTAQQTASAIAMAVGLAHEETAAAAQGHYYAINHDNRPSTDVPNGPGAVCIGQSFGTVVLSWLLQYQVCCTALTVFSSWKLRTVFGESAAYRHGGSSCRSCGVSRPSRSPLLPFSAPSPLNLLMPDAPPRPL